MRRLRGLFVITRALLPIIVVVGLLGATWLTSRLLVNATGRYGDNLATQLEGVQQAVAEANEGLEAIGSFVTSTADAAESLVARVGELRSSVTIELPSIAVPEFTVLDRIIDLPDLRLGDGLLEIPIPGIEPLQGIANDLAAAGARVAEPVVKVAALAQVPPQLEAAAQDTAAYASDVRAALRWWLLAIALVLLVGSLVWLGSALAPIAGEVRRGWSMLAGRQAPDRADLTARVEALEARVFV